MRRDGNLKKKQQLGISAGTATARLRRAVLFKYLELAGETQCFRCGHPMTVDDYSMDHKAPWLDGDIALFWSLDNVAFSHLGCNIRDARKPMSRHGAVNRYYRGCRCALCCAANTEACRRKRERRKLLRSS